MTSWSQLSELPQRALERLGVWPWLEGAPVSAWLLGGVLVLGSTAWLVAGRHKLPPGPTGIPFIGFVAGFPSQPLHIQCAQYSKKYNSDVISYRRMGTLYVVIHGYKLIKEAYLTRGPDFAERPLMAIEVAGFKDEMFVQPNNDQFRKDKKFGISSLRNYGTGNRSMEGRILAEFYKVTDYLTDLKGSPVDLMQTVKHALARVVTSILYSSDYSTDDPEVDYILALIRGHFENNFGAELEKACLLPSWIRNLFYRKSIRRARQANGKIKQFMMGKINEHRKILDRSNPRDVMDQYLIARDGPSVDENLLAFTLFVYTVDAIESLSAIVMTGILHIIENPEVMSRIQTELDRIVGKSGEPKLSHKDETKYLHAVTLETLRMSHTVPLGGDHRPLKKTKIGGYDIPDNCIVYVSLYSVHMDPDIFPEPEVFKPEHFLDDQGNIKNNEYCIPFSVGRRMCIGEQLSKMELYLFYATIFHKFSFKFEPGSDEKAEEKDYISFVLQTPKARKICAIAR